MLGYVGRLPWPRGIGSSFAFSSNPTAVLLYGFGFSLRACPFFAWEMVKTVKPPEEIPSLPDYSPGKVEWGPGRITLQHRSRDRE